MIERLTLENLRRVRGLHVVECLRYGESMPKEWNLVLVGESKKPIFFPNVPSTSLWFMHQLVQAITGFVFVREIPGVFTRTEQALPQVSASETHAPLTLENLRQVQELHVNSQQEKLALFLQKERQGRITLNATSTNPADNQYRLLYDVEYLWVLELVSCVTGRQFKSFRDGYSGIWQAQ